MKTATWLKEMRKKHNITQKELANKTGLSIHSLQNIEQGQRKGSKESWEKIINFFENKA